MKSEEDSPTLSLKRAIKVPSRGGLSCRFYLFSFLFGMVQMFFLLKDLLASESKFTNDIGHVFITV